MSVQLKLSNHTMDRAEEILFGRDSSSDNNTTIHYMSALYWAAKSLPDNGKEYCHTIGVAMYNTGCMAIEREPYDYTDNMCELVIHDGTIDVNTVIREILHNIMKKTGVVLKLE